MTYINLKTMLHMKKSVVWLVLMSLAACNTSAPPAGEQESDTRSHPKNIILLIGDGMGLSAASVPFYFGDAPSNFTRLPHVSLINTSSATHKVTGSAASGTAMAAGKKTYNGAIGVDTARMTIQNITEWVSGIGWSTGVVSTSSITHATPASYYAHVEQRGMQEEIARQLIDSDIDFFAGGGTGFFNRRSDGADLFPLASANGFTLDTLTLPRPGALDPEKKYGFLLAPDAMPPAHAERGDFLPDATALAIGYLSSNEEGFFLMVESSQIDWAGHANDTEYMIAEMLDFEKVMKIILDFAEKDGETLVVVTADHETGGFTLSAASGESGGSDYRKISPSFATGGHSASLIPVFAYGPGAEAFAGIYQNTGIFHKMKAATTRE